MCISLCRVSTFTVKSERKIWLRMVQWLHLACTTQTPVWLRETLKDLMTLMCELCIIREIIPCKYLWQVKSSQKILNLLCCHSHTFLLCLVRLPNSLSPSPAANIQPWAPNTTWIGSTYFYFFHFLTFKSSVHHCGSPEPQVVEKTFKCCHYFNIKLSIQCVIISTEYLISLT